MSVTYRKETYSARFITQATDAVIAWAEIPQNSKQVHASGEVHVVQGNAERGEQDEAYIYSCEGWVIPVEDPDTAQNIDTLWDTMLSKSGEFTSIVDIDTGTAQTNPRYAPGEGDITGLLGLNIVEDSNQWFQRDKMLSYANSPRSFVQQTPTTDDSFTATDIFEYNTAKNIEADGYSMSLLGFGVPPMSDNASSISSPAGEAAWWSIMFLEETLRVAAIDILGLVETGAETPFEDMAAFMGAVLTPDALIPVGVNADLDGTDFHVFTKAQFMIQVPGTLDFGRVISAR